MKTKPVVYPKPLTSCPACPKTFARATGLHNHLKFKHPNVWEALHKKLHPEPPAPSEASQEALNMANGPNDDKCREALDAPDIQPASPMPTLIRCGNTFINPRDVSMIKEVKRGLFIVKFRDEPNPEFPTWLREEEVGALLAYFDVKGG
jgi:hypothetical protein